MNELVMSLAKNRIDENGKADMDKINESVPEVVYLESRKVLNFPPVTNFPYQNLPPIFEVLLVDRVGLRRGSCYKLREHILVSYSYGFELMVIVAEHKLVLE